MLQPRQVKPHARVASHDEGCLNVALQVQANLMGLVGACTVLAAEYRLEKLAASIDLDAAAAASGVSAGDQHLLPVSALCSTPVFCCYGWDLSCSCNLR